MSASTTATPGRAHQPGTLMAPARAVPRDCASALRRGGRWSISVSCVSSTGVVALIYIPSSWGWCPGGGALRLTTYPAAGTRGQPQALSIDSRTSSTDIWPVSRPVTPVPSVL